MQNNILKIGIVGARKRHTENDKELLRKALKQLLERSVEAKINVVLVSGGAHAGADRFAEELAQELNLPIEVYKPVLNDHTASKQEYVVACFARNTTIAQQSDILLATPNLDKDGTPFGGTADTIRKAKALNKLVMIL